MQQQRNANTNELWLRKCKEGKHKYKVIKCLKG